MIELNIDSDESYPKIQYSFELVLGPAEKGKRKPKVGGKISGHFNIAGENPDYAFARVREELIEMGRRLIKGAGSPPAAQPVLQPAAPEAVEVKQDFLEALQDPKPLPKPKDGVIPAAPTRRVGKKGRKSGGKVMKPTSEKHKERAEALGDG